VAHPRPHQHLLRSALPDRLAALDPHSHATTAIRPLEAAGVKVTKPSSGEVAEAHGLFLETLAAGRIRHQGQPEFTTDVCVFVWPAPEWL
jgi:hypothetical protein